jgi:hypothetical protein
VAYAETVKGADSAQLRYVWQLAQGLCRSDLLYRFLYPTQHGLIPDLPQIPPKLRRKVVLRSTPQDVEDLGGLYALGLPSFPNGLDKSEIL